MGQVLTNHRLFKSLKPSDDAVDTEKKMSLIFCPSPQKGRHQTIVTGAKLSATNILWAGGIRAGFQASAIEVCCVVQTRVSIILRTSF